jgi:hypothetical protein
MRTAVPAPGGRPLAALAILTALAVFPRVPAAAQAHVDDPVARYAEALGQVNVRLARSARYELAQRFLLLASYYRIDPALLMAVVTVESSWHPHAVSRVGAVGYGQLMPSTAARLGVDPLEPYENLDGTARYLRRLLNAYARRPADQRLRLAVTAYNAGPGAVARYHGVPPYAETRRYVANVLHWRSIYSQLASGRLDIARLLAQSATHPPPRKAVRVRHAAPTRTPPPRAPAPSPTPSPLPLAVAEPSPSASPTPEPIVVHRHGVAAFFARVFHRRHEAAGPAETATAAALPARN